MVFPKIKSQNATQMYLIESITSIYENNAEIIKKHQFIYINKMLEVKLCASTRPEGLNQFTCDLN